MFRRFYRWLQRQFDRTKPEVCFLRFCGNCHNVLWVIPGEAMNQVFEADGLIHCNCGAPVVGEFVETEWAP